MAGPLALGHRAAIDRLGQCRTEAAALGPHVPPHSVVSLRLDRCVGLRIFGEGVDVVLVEFAAVPSLLEGAT